MFSFICRVINNMKKNKIPIWSIVFWIVIWHLISIIIDERIILASPILSLQKLGTLIWEVEFWITIAFSLFRISIGFLIACISGILLAFSCNKFHLLKQLISPLILFFKSIPVASFVIIILMWFSSSSLTIIISIIMVLPVIYSNVLTALEFLDEELTAMAEVLRINKNTRFRYIYLSQILPYFRSACILSIGLCFKAGIAAEVIGLPSNSIGENLFQAKIFFDTPSLFAWTIVIAILSYLFEKICEKTIDITCSALLRIKTSHDITNLNGLSFGGQSNSEPSIKEFDNNSILDNAPNSNFELKNICKSYDMNLVLKDINMEFNKGEFIALIGQSGAGKTTLLKIMMNLESPDSGTIIGFNNLLMSAVFQEDRLCDNLDVYTNIALPHIKKGNRALISKEKIDDALIKLKLETSNNKVVGEFSGGMKRRVALLRALLANYDVLFLDEPFKGLDEETKLICMDYFKNKIKEKTVILITHDIRELEHLKPTKTYEI